MTQSHYYAEVGQAEDIGGKRYRVWLKGGDHAGTWIYVWATSDEQARFLADDIARHLNLAFQAGSDARACDIRVALGVRS